MEKLAAKNFELAQRVIAAAIARNAKIAVAESLTGGLLAATLVQVPGASAVFVGAVVAYDTAVKQRVLEVDARRLAATGPVDQLVAAQMVCGLGAALGVKVTHGVATTGVAGPDPDPQTGKPVGLFYVAAGELNAADAVTASDAIAVTEHQVRGDREAVRLSAVGAALELLLQQLQHDCEITV